MNGLIDFECGMVVGVLIILETADLLGLLFIYFLHTTIFRIDKECSEKEKIYTVDVRGERSDCFKLTQKHRKKNIR